MAVGKAGGSAFGVSRPTKRVSLGRTDHDRRESGSATRPTGEAGARCLAACKGRVTAKQDSGGRLERPVCLSSGEVVTSGARFRGCLRDLADSVLMLVSFVFGAPAPKTVFEPDLFLQALKA